MNLPLAALDKLATENQPNANEIHCSLWKSVKKDKRWARGGGLEQQSKFIMKEWLDITHALLVNTSLKGTGGTCKLHTLLGDLIRKRE